MPVLIVVLAIALVGVACVTYGVAIERTWFRLRRYRLAILPSDGPERLSVLHLSDLHFVRDDPKKARFLASLPAADVTVVTGDFLAEPEAVEAAVAGVRTVRGRMASWFVLGSNDYYAARPRSYFSYFGDEQVKRPRPIRGRAPELIEQLSGDGWADLTNSRRLVEVDGLPLELLGLGDAHIQRHDLRVAPRGAPERFGFAVMHSPDSAPETAALGYELLVAGHTHGGQVCLPLIGALVTNCSMPRRLVAGLFQMGGAVLHTSPGLGTSKFAPFRFCCRPQATVLELSRRPTAS
ncbi:MAG TPA: metallophosphoesterase [Actinomycetota bacterium]|nr:metallophosphoesterase [Actinomycetota bacterium]